MLDRKFDFKYDFDVIQHLNEVENFKQLAQNEREK